MTTKTNITLPPLPGALVDVETKARAYARAAVEADRQGRVPSDEINEVVNDALTNLEHDNYEQSYKGYENRQADVALIRALLSRYSSGQPAASAEPVLLRELAAWISNLPVPTKGATAMLMKIDKALSAAPVAQDHDEALANTQRAIIEAAERRGYERAIAECAQVARAAKGADHG